MIVRCFGVENEALQVSVQVNDTTGNLERLFWTNNLGRSATINVNDLSGVTLRTVSIPAGTGEHVIPKGQQRDHNLHSVTLVMA